MFENEALNAVLYLLGLLGVGGIVGGIVVKGVTRRIDESDARREALEQARLEADLLNGDGLCCVGDLAEATATALKEGRTNGETTAALGGYRKWRERRDAFVALQAAKNLRREA